MSWLAAFTFASDWVELRSLHLHQIIQAVVSFLKRCTELLRHVQDLAFQDILDTLRAVFTSDVQNLFHNRSDTVTAVPLPCT